MPRKYEGPKLWWNKARERWYVHFRVDGKPDRVSTGSADRGEAERFLAQFIAGMHNPAAPAALTISKILDGYLEERKGKVRAYSSIKYACDAIRRHLGWLEMEHLTSATLETYAKKRFEEGVKRVVQGREVRKDIRPATIAREVQTLRAALRWAQGARWIDVPPPLKMPVKGSPPKERWLTKTEAAALLNACASFHVKLFVTMALNTGARVGAILELPWDRVDMIRGIIDFGPGHGNKRRAVVPISGQLRVMLDDAKKLAVSDFVIEHNGEPIRSIKTAFNAAVGRAKLEAGVTIHTLRHTAATWMVQASIPLAEVARMLGDSEKMIEKVYGKHAPDYLKRAVGALNF